MLNIIAAILMFGIIVLVHEFGHFIAAKLNGIYVVVFSIGFGPRLLSFQKGETRYSLKIIPLRGSCLMLNEFDSAEEAGVLPEGMTKEEADERGFINKSVWARIVTVAAGPVFNFLLAFLCALIVVGRVGYMSPQVIQVESGSPAWEAGIREGDRITRINGKEVEDYRDIELERFVKPGQTMTLQWSRLTENGDEVYSAEVTPEYSAESGSYLLGVYFPGYVPADGIGEILKYSVYNVKYQIKAAILSLGMLVQGQVSADNVSGPVKIVSVVSETVGEARQYGFEVVMLNLMNLCIIISANLAVINLLPIPGLDGGRLLFLIIEALRRKPLDQEKEGMIHAAGLALLMVFMVFILFNDIQSLL